MLKDEIAACCKALNSAEILWKTATRLKLKAMKNTF